MRRNTGRKAEEAEEVKVKEEEDALMPLLATAVLDSQEDEILG